MCDCDCGAFYVSRRTVFEWLGWKLGYYKQADLSGLIAARGIPLGEAAAGTIGEHDS